MSAFIENKQHFSYRNGSCSECCPSTRKRVFLLLSLSCHRLMALLTMHCFRSAQIVFTNFILCLSIQCCWSVGTCLALAAIIINTVSKLCW